jgi:hypothetical protein
MKKKPVKKFQIMIGTKESHTCIYFECSDNEREAACVKMKEYLEKMYENNSRYYPFSQKSAPNQVLVQEMDMENLNKHGYRDVKKGGIKFKLKRGYLKLTYKGGGSDLQEWYNAVDIIKKQPAKS